MKHFFSISGLSGAPGFPSSANLSRALLSLAVLSLISLPLLSGCSSSMSTTTTTMPPVITPPSTTEPNSCTATNVTSPAPPTPTSNYAGTAFTGKVLAGSSPAVNPVIGASVQLYAAGTAGNGSAPTALLTTPLTTDANGAFSVAATFTCPLSNSVVYAVATGGHAGATGAPNAGTVLATVLGPCNSLSANPAITINEATTVATATAMAQFLAPGGKMGAASTNGLGIGLAAGTAANLVSVATGIGPGKGFPPTGTAPTARIDSLANLLDACVISSGASSSACTQLYADTARSSVTPSNTLDAALNLVRQPAANVAALYMLSTASTAFSPALSAAPTDWTLFAVFAGGGMNAPSAVAIDSLGNIWVANYFSVASLFSNTGVPTFTTGITGNSLYNSYGAAVDPNNTVWIPNEQNPGVGLGSVTQLTSAGTSPAVLTTGGLDFPIAAAFDTGGTAWIVDYGNSHMTLYNASGTPLSGASGYTARNLVFPVAVATDSKCNAYIANQSSDTITRVTADGSTFTDFVTGNGGSSVAVGPAGDVWVGNYYGGSVGLVSSTGTVLSSGGFKGGGITQPQGIAVDGAGNAWVANYRGVVNAGDPITELAGASASTPGAALSPATGFGIDANMVETFGIAIDPAGNLWLSNFGTNTLTEFVGLASPVKTPLLGPVRVP